MPKNASVADLPSGIRKRVCVEAGASMGWHRWAGDEGAVIAIDRYGASAPGDQVMKKFGFTVERVAATALRLLGKSGEADALEPAQEGETASARTSPQEGHS